MIRELELVGQQDPPAAVKWSKKNVDLFKKNFKKRGKDEALKGVIHDSLQFGCGSASLKVLLWKFIGVC
jgi:hypothetical protein